MNYFADCKTIEQASQLYRNLAMVHHPDHGGDTATMQMINGQYAAVITRLQLTAKAELQEDAHEDNRRTYADYNDLSEIFAELKTKIEAVINLSREIEIELCGAWIWLHGNTRPIKDQLKAEHFRWSPNKQLWYFAGVRTFNRKTRTMEEIRTMHGSAFVRAKQAEALP
jgi:hypothetical protein